MNEHNSDSDIYLQLMAISQEALEGGHYETAYHSLVAAMHHAQALSNEERLLRVETVARTQQDWIDSHAPNHRLSTQSAVKRQGKSLYNMLARQAATQELIVKHEDRLKNTERKPWAGDAD